MMAINKGANTIWITLFTMVFCVQQAQAQELWPQMAKTAHLDSLELNPFGWIHGDAIHELDIVHSHKLASNHVSTPFFQVLTFSDSTKIELGKGDDYTVYYKEVDKGGLVTAEGTLKKGAWKGQDSFSLRHLIRVDTLLVLDSIFHALKTGVWVYRNDTCEFTGGYLDNVPDGKWTMHKVVECTPDSSAARRRIFESSYFYFQKGQSLGQEAIEIKFNSAATTWKPSGRWALSSSKDNCAVLYNFEHRAWSIDLDFYFDGNQFTTDYHPICGPDLDDEGTWELKDGQLIFNGKLNIHIFDVLYISQKEVALRLVKWAYQKKE